MMPDQVNNADEVKRSVQTLANFDRFLNICEIEYYLDEI